MKKFLILIMLAGVFSGCAGLQQSEQARAPFASYSLETPADADKLLFSDTGDSDTLHTVLANNLPIGTATQAALDLKINLSNTIDYTAYPVDTWGLRTEYAECDSIYQAINDSALSIDDLPDATEIAVGDDLIIQKSGGTTSKIDAVMFRQLINKDLFGSDAVIVRPEDDLLDTINGNTLPCTFILTQGTHSLDVTDNTGALDLTGANFLGYGKGQTFLNIITRENTVLNYIKINGVLYFRDLSIDMSSEDISNNYHFLNDTADAHIYFIDCDVEQSTNEPYYFFGQTDNTKEFNLYIKDSTFLSEYTAELFLASTTPQLKLYAANSSIGGRYTFDNATNNLLKADNCVFTKEIQFLNLDTNTIDFFLSDVIFKTLPVTSGEHPDYNILIRGNTNYVLPTTGGGLFWELNMLTKMGLTNTANQFIPFKYWNLSGTASVTENYQVTSQPIFSFNMNVTSATNLILSNAMMPFDMRFYLKAGGEDLAVATSYSSGWVYTDLPGETIIDVKTVPCSAAFPVFPDSASDTKIQRQVIAW